MRKDIITSKNVAVLEDLAIRTSDDDLLARVMGYQGKNSQHYKEQYGETSEAYRLASLVEAENCYANPRRYGLIDRLKELSGLSSKESHLKKGKHFGIVRNRDEALKNLQWYYKIIDVDTGRMLGRLDGDSAKHLLYWIRERVRFERLAEEANAKKAQK